MATYAIGDVQGCFATLMTLLEAIAFDRVQDRLWFAGDLVNRGPRSLEVVRFVMGLGDRAVTVLGNHELHLFAVAYSGRRLKSKDTVAAILEAPDREAMLTWLRHRPFLHYDAALETVMVHAGLPPQWTLSTAVACAKEASSHLQDASFAAFLQHIMGNHAATWPEAPEAPDRLPYIINCFTRMRFCDAQGRLELASKGPPGTQPEPYLPWFCHAHRAHAETTAVFGHWAALGAYTAPGVYALDTGCVWGEELTALCLETKTRTSVPYAESS
jgi:bis(5'-nucleosyl)-tetraphosphatase (symmetrical)